MVALGQYINNQYSKIQGGFSRYNRYQFPYYKLKYDVSMKKEDSVKIRKLALLTYLICLSLVMSSCGNTSTVDANKSIPDSDLQMLVDRGDRTPDQIARELELKLNRTYEDLIDLGTSYLWMGEYSKAAEAYEVAARQAKTTPQLVGALYNKTGALAYAGYMQEALNTIDLMVRLQPENIEVAKLRYTLYQFSGDKLGLMAAADHLVALDPSLAGEEVLDPVTASVIIASVAVVAASATTITAVALVPPEDRVDVVVPIMEGYTTIVSDIVTSRSLANVWWEKINK